MKRRIGIHLLGALLLACTANAQEGATRGYLTNELTAGQHQGWAPFVGLGAGYTAYTNELDVEGVPTTAKVLGSFATRDQKNIFDLGAGFQNQSFSQEAATDRNVQSTVAEAAYRYRWDNGIQGGVVWNTLFNEGDNYGANQADAQFAGLQVLKEFSMGQKWLARAGGRYMTDVNVDGTWLNQVMLELQIGWNPATRTSVQAADAVAPTTPDVASDQAFTDANEEPVASIEDVGLRRDLLLFDLDSAELTSAEQEKLERLAAALEENPDLVGKVEVIGHADTSGPESHNMTLSEQRAESVKKVLTKKGVSANKIETVGRGEEQPIGGSADRSRRVEVRLKDVKDPQEAEKLIKSIE